MDADPVAPVAPGEASRMVELAGRVRDGDAEAEERVARLFHGRVRTFLLVRTRDPETAGDLAQETLIAVIQALRAGQLREAGRLPAFVYGTARNVLNGFFRSRRREPPTEPVGPDTALADPRHDPETRAASFLVRRALDELAPQDREILELVLVYGMKPREIVARTGVPAEAVRQRKSRALRRLADRLRGLSRNAAS